MSRCISAGRRLLPVSTDLIITAFGIQGHERLRTVRYKGTSARGAEAFVRSGELVRWPVAASSLPFVSHTGRLAVTSCGRFHSWPLTTDHRRLATDRGSLNLDASPISLVFNDIVGRLAISRLFSTTSLGAAHSISPLSFVFNKIVGS